MILFWIALGLILLVIIFSNRSKKPPANEKIIADANNYRKNFNSRPSDELYAHVESQHNTKSLEQIKDYVESHRKNNDPYWGRNRMEYKILMERQKLLQNLKDDEMRNLLASDKIYSQTYNELLPTYWLIKNNQHIYGDINLVRLRKVLDELSFKKFEPLLKEQSPSKAVQYLEARRKESEYISDELHSVASEMEASESEEVIYKRKLKNLQSRLSKAKKESIQSKIAEIQEELDRFKK